MLTQSSSLISSEYLGEPTQTGFAHVAFGLTLQSDFPIPELPIAPQATASEPVVVRLQPGDLRDHIPEALLEQPIGFQIKDQSAVVYLNGVGVFLVNGGNHVTVIPAVHAPELQVRQALMGIVMALVLHQRNYLVLHGSAVSIEGKAIIFLADSGEGKSSMAAALYAQGYPLLTDDLTAIDLAGAARVAIAATPIKLYPEMAQLLKIDDPSQALPNKHLYQINVQPDLGPQPLHRIFILGSAPTFAVAPPLPLPQAITELMRFSGLKAILPARDAAHFSQCAALAQACPIQELKRPRDVSQLSKIAAQIAQEIAYDR
ncbi:MAG: hypothetical protein ACFCU8_03325 [Thermosynechococcaceae cyanobacterium]